MNADKTMRQHIQTTAIVALGSLAMLGSFGCPSTSAVIVDGANLTDADLTIGFSQARYRDSGDYSEQLKIEVALEGGGSVYTRLLVTNIANADGRAEMLTKVTLPAAAGEATGTEGEDDGTVRLREKNRAEKDAWSYGKGRFDVTVGAQTIVVDTQGATVHAEGDGFVLDYTIAPQMGPLRPTGGAADFGGVNYLTTLPIPRGIVTGTVRLTPEDGEPETRSFTGVAFVEHRLTNVAPYTMAQRWYKLSQVTLDETVVFSTFQKAPEVGEGLQGWLMVVNEKGLEVYESDLTVVPDAWSVDPDTGYRVPALLFVYDKTREHFRGVFSLNGVTKRKDQLKRLSRLERFVVKRFMKPWLFEHSGAQYLFKKRVGAGIAEQDHMGTVRVDVQQLNPDPK